MSWFKLAERYVSAFEDYSRSFARNLEAQARLAESHLRRNEQLADIDERNARANEIQVATAADSKNVVERVAEHLGVLAENILRIDAKLDCRAPSDTSGEVKP